MCICARFNVSHPLMRVRGIVILWLRKVLPSRVRWPTGGASRGRSDSASRLHTSRCVNASKPHRRASSEPHAATADAAFLSNPRSSGRGRAFLGSAELQNNKLLWYKRTLSAFQENIHSHKSCFSLYKHVKEEKLQAVCSSRTPHYPEHKLCLKSHVRRSVGIGTIYIRKDWLITINWQRP